MHPIRCELRLFGLMAAIGMFAWFAPVGRALLAQGVATTAIRGSVQMADGGSVDGAQVRVVNTATGFAVETVARDGRFLVSGLEVAGPYTITVRRLGFLPAQGGPLFLALGEPLELRFVLQPLAIPLGGLSVIASPDASRGHTHGGTATTVTDSLLHRLPTLNRDLYDFVRLVPQISTKIGLSSGGLSGGGVGFRFNSFLINGAPERFVSGNSSLALLGGKSVPLEAVREYQVLLAPYDVRYGDFAGALINTVTRSGTNEPHGSAFAYFRNDRLARRGDLAPIVPYERVQYGFSLGGPLLRDRMHFYVAPELQSLTSPAEGPYLGQSSAAMPPVPVNAADLARFDSIMSGYGLAAGSPGQVQTGNPLTNVFARLDVAIPEWKSRAILLVNHIRTERTSFSRTARDTFSLSSFKLKQRFESRMTALQLHTALRRAGGGHNELLVSYRPEWGLWLSPVKQPVVRVAVPSTSGGLVTLNTGTHPSAQGMSDESWTLAIKENLTLPFGVAHVVTLGLEAERFRLGRRGLIGSYGTWTFTSLDSLLLGIPDRYELRRVFGSVDFPIPGAQYAAYAADQWRVSERLQITLGVRADLLAIDGRAPYNPAVDSIFQRRTDAVPSKRVHLSPRLGFTWDVFREGRDQVRGGVGVFTGRPPLLWAHSALYNYGVGIGVLRCGDLATDLGPPPAFVPDIRSAPTTCANGSGLATAPMGDVDLLDRRLRMAQTLRASLAYERQLPWSVLLTGEALITRNISDFVFFNLNLQGPQSTDRFGRVLYGTINSSGVAAPALRSGFSEVIDLRNTSRNRSYQISARIERRFADGVAATASYTYSRVRDVQTPLRAGQRGIVAWSSARAVSGRHEDLRLATSLYEIPHRVVLGGTYTAPWQGWSTRVSFYYLGESGSPFTYRAWGAGRRGDLNSDGSNENDPIYVPRNTSDTAEIRFSGLSEEAGADNSPEAQAERVVRQQAAFQRAIQRTDCLRRQRGRIVERNSCREPWSHVTIASVRQAIPVAGRGLVLELDIFNVLNLLNSKWGRYRVAAPALLEHVGQTSGSPATAQPIFRFDASAPQWTTLETESAFQLQVALRYDF
ncbi:MAG: TonB-dependent receptor domain-containing protein [Gemmatimonadales bacterium]